MIRFISEDMNDGEIAAMYEDGADAVIMVNERLPDAGRSEAVNKLLAGRSCALTL